MSTRGNRKRTPKPPPAIAPEPPPQESPPTPSPSPERWVHAGRVLAAMAGTVLVFGASLAVAWAARRYVTTSPRFSIKNVTIHGGVRRTEAELSALVGSPLGKNIFLVDPDDAKTSLLADPWIRTATVTRRLPGTLLVDVTEREAAAVLALSDTYLVSREGEVIKRVEPGDPVDFPVITGLDPDRFARDRDSATSSVRDALDVATEYEHGPVAKRAALQEVHVGRGGELTLTVGKGGIALVLGKKPYRAKLEQAARVLSEVDKQGAQAEALMLDNEARPDRVVVRLH